MHFYPATSGVFIATRECFKQLPEINEPRHTDDAGFTLGAVNSKRANNADGYKSCSYSVLSKLEGVLLPAVLSLGMGEARNYIF